MVQPRTPVEEAIAEIWRDVLDRSDVGVLDDFFDLDGDSLGAIQVIARIRETWGVGIKSMTFFAEPTVAALASAVDAGTPSERPVVSRRRRDADPVPSFDQQRLWLESQLRPEAAYNVHGRILLTGPLDVAALEASIRAVLLRHEALRTRFPVVDGQPVQVVDDLHESWRLDVVDLAGETRDDALRLADEDAATCFDLAHGPLFLCRLVRSGDTEHLLSITAHHIVCDDWSTGLFLRELSLLYQVGGDAGRAELPALPVQYADFAVWQREWLAGEEGQRQVAYWRDELAGAPAALMLPTAEWRPSSERPTGRRLTSELSPAETSALHELCRSHGVTSFMVLLTGLATVLGRWSGQRDVVVGVPITGRTDAGTENLVGFFVNTLPLRVDLSGDPTFADLLERVRRTAVAGYEHAEAPLDLLVEELRPPRVPGRTPLFQVLLNVVDDFEIAPLRGLSTQVLDPPTQPSKLDLTLSVREVGGTVHLGLEFNADRYQEAMVRVLFEHLRTLLGAASADPASSVFDYPLGTDLATPEGAGTSAVARDWAVDRFDVGADDRFAVLSPRSGRLASSAASTAAAVGATLVRPDAPLPPDPDEIAGWLQDNAVSVVYLDPPVLRAVASRAPAVQLPALRYAFVDNPGDLVAHDVEALRRLSATCRFVGVYRVGDDGRPLAAYAVPDGWKLETAPLRVPLGTEVTETPVRLRHPTGRSCAVGEVAEICFGDLRTGDLGRRWDDGTLEPVGRLGGDPAADPVLTVGALREVPDVHDAVVTEHATQDGGTVLAGYVAAADPGLDPGGIHSHLVSLVPDHLLPRHLFVLDRIPLTSEGAYDLAALPRPDDGSTPLGTYVAPRTPVERRLTEILQEILEIDRVGIHSSFFELGGFSLLATRLSSRIRETFRVDVSLRDLFEAVTVERLAQLIVRSQAQLSDADDLDALLTEIESSGRERG